MHTQGESQPRELNEKLKLREKIQIWRKDEGMEWHQFWGEDGVTTLSTCERREGAVREL